MGIFDRIFKASFSISGTTLIKYTGSDKKVVIPDGIKTIDQSAFEDSDIEEVVFSDSVEVINPYAFRGCVSLKKVTFGEHLHYIGYCAFWGCKSLKVVFIPDNISYVGECAFEDCSNAEIVYPNIRSYDAYSGIQKDAFNGCRKTRCVDSVWKYVRRLPVEEEEEIIESDSSDVSDGDSSSGSVSSVKTEKKGKKSISKIFKKKIKGKYAFICYDSNNDSEAEALHTLLDKERVDTWMESYDLGSDDYSSVAKSAISDSGCVALLLSDKAQNSSQVLNDVKTSIDVGVPIVVLHIDDSAVRNEFRYYIANQQIFKVESIDKSDIHMQMAIKSIVNNTKKRK